MGRCAVGTMKLRWYNNFAQRATEHQERTFSPFPLSMSLAGWGSDKLDLPSS